VQQVNRDAMQPGADDCGDCNLARHRKLDQEAALEAVHVLVLTHRLALAWIVLRYCCTLLPAY
jgi:hypothetical protein